MVRIRSARMDPCTNRKHETAYTFNTRPHFSSPHLLKLRVQHPRVWARLSIFSTPPHENVTLCRVAFCKLHTEVGAAAALPMERIRVRRRGEEGEGEGRGGDKVRERDSANRKMITASTAVTSISRSHARPLEHDAKATCCPSPWTTFIAIRFF